MFLIILFVLSITVTVTSIIDIFLYYYYYIGTNFQVHGTVMTTLFTHKKKTRSQYIGGRTESLYIRVPQIAFFAIHLKSHWRLCLKGFFHKIV